MGSKDYELLKMETKIHTLEKELAHLFNEFSLATDRDAPIDDPTYDKLQKMNICCLELLKTYRVYTINLKKHNSTSV